MGFQLNRKNVGRLSNGFVEEGAFNNKVLHFGVGGFHRAHQADYLKRLNDGRRPGTDPWSILGACILERDGGFVGKMREQDCLYTLKTISPSGDVKTSVIDSISHVYHGPSEVREILDSIGSEQVSVISFTITEGGYMIDGSTGGFMLDHPLVQHDLGIPVVPKTIFGYLAQGLRLRRDRGLGRVTMLSCDNVQENGQVLKNSLEAFLRTYDAGLLEYVKGHVHFPNSMVDRITPVATQGDRDRFALEYGYRDECLVISEDFSQWVMERPETDRFPALERVGVKMVSDVRPYEKMKLRMLNGGHSLVGFLGRAMGYRYIHQAVKDPLISKVFDAYMEHEVIPSLDFLYDVDYQEYARSVKFRFGNELICDSTDRIISFSSDKIPKFVLPVLEHARPNKGLCTIACLVLASWWCYLDESVKGRSDLEVKDERWKELKSGFLRPRGESIQVFLNRKEVFGYIGTLPLVQDTVAGHIEDILSKGMAKAVSSVLDTYKK